MEFYTIYKLEFDLSNRDLFSRDNYTLESSKEELIKGFLETLENKPIDKIETDRKTYKCYPYIKDNIVLLRIINEKTIEIVHNFETVLVDHEPFQNVIFYLDKECSYLAIEISSTFRSNTDTVNNIILEGISNYLKSDYSSININSDIIIKPMAFWLNVDYLLKHTNDTLTEITVKTRHKHTANNEIENMENIQDISEVLNCNEIETHTYSNIENNNEKQLNTAFGYIKNFTKNKDFEIETKFKKYGRLKQDSTLRVKHEIDQTITNGFISLFEEKNENEEYEATKIADDKENKEPDFYFQLFQRLEDIKKSVIYTMSNER